MTADHVHAPAARVVGRVLALLLVLLVGLTATAPAARATAEAPAGEEERLTYEQLQQQASQRAQEFFPEAYEEPSFFQWLSVPVLLAGLAMTIALLAAYLWWQPKFAAERRAKDRR